MHISSGVKCLIFDSAMIEYRGDLGLVVFEIRGTENES